MCYDIHHICSTEWWLRVLQLQHATRKIHRSIGLDWGRVEIVLNIHPNAVPYFKKQNQDVVNCSYYNYHVYDRHLWLSIPVSRGYNTGQHWKFHIGEILKYSTPGSRNWAQLHFYAGSWWLFADKTRSTTQQSSTIQSLAKCLWEYAKGLPRLGWMHFLCYICQSYKK